MPDPIIHFQPLGRKVESKKGRTLLELAEEAGLSIESVCGAAGKCAGFSAQAGPSTRGARPTSHRSSAAVGTCDLDRPASRTPCA